MKLLGLIGGMSWESTAQYYELINQEIKRRLGGFHSCHCMIYSVDFANIEKWQHTDDRIALRNEMINAVHKLDLGSSDLIILCTNTMHQYFEEMQSSTQTPLLHIAKAAGDEMLKRHLQKPAILGTKFTMEGDFYSGYLSRNFNFSPIIPKPEQRNKIHRVIYEELVKGIISKESRADFSKIIDDLKSRGADSVVLGCTEIPLLIQQSDSNLPVIDTTQTHALAAVNKLLSYDKI